MVAKSLLSTVITEVPLALHRSFKAGADEAMMNVGARARGGGYTVQPFGMAAYAEFDAALGLAAKSVGLAVERRSTVPRGGTYTLARAGRFFIHRYTGHHQLALPRRQPRYLPPLLAQNIPVDPQGDLLRERVAGSADRLFACYVTVPDYRNANCAHIGFGLLSPDGQRWIDYWALEDLMAAYVPGEQVHDTARAVVQDRAQPTLKKRNQ